VKLLLALAALWAAAIGALIAVRIARGPAYIRAMRGAS
jgi:hypothetical protein